MKAQSSIEFLSMISMIALIFAILSGVVVSKQAEVNQYQNTQTAEQIAEKASFEVEMALVQGPGYSRNFTLPEQVGGNYYRLQLEEGNVLMEWEDQNAIASSRYYGDPIELQSSQTNRYKAVNEEGEVDILER